MDRPIIELACWTCGILEIEIGDVVEVVERKVYPFDAFLAVSKLVLHCKIIHACVEDSGQIVSASCEDDDSDIDYLCIARLVYFCLVEIKDGDAYLGQAAPVVCRESDCECGGGGGGDTGIES